MALSNYEEKRFAAIQEGIKHVAGPASGAPAIELTTSDDLPARRRLVRRVQEWLAPLDLRKEARRKAALWTGIGALCAGALVGGAYASESVAAPAEPIVTYSVPVTSHSPEKMGPVVPAGSGGPESEQIPPQTHVIGLGSLAAQPILSQ